jgi:hypothetical protein
MTIHGNHETAHAVLSAPAHAETETLAAADAAPHQSPCSPLEQHQDADGCDSCLNCACHAPLASQLFRLGYTPIIVRQSRSETFTYLPEVYLPRFIPPQIQV